MSESRHPVDIVGEAEARLAFIRVAVGALCEVDDGLLPRKKAFEGLYYLTLDLEVMLHEAVHSLPQ